jgi:hypothetical protein
MCAATLSGSGIDGHDGEVREGVGQFVVGKALKPGRPLPRCAHWANSFVFHNFDHTSWRKIHGIYFGFSSKTYLGTSLVTVLGPEALLLYLEPRLRM